jgi:small subunit ribosomal protein S2
LILIRGGSRLLPVFTGMQRAKKEFIMSSYDVDSKELLEAGCHFGHQAKRWNPKMKPFIYVQRDGVHIFDLVKTGTCLETAMEYVRDTVKAGKEVVFIGAKRQAKSIVLEEAMKVGAPYVTERWLGGMLTNWEEMEKRLRKLSTLKKQRDNNELTHYTKKERLMINKEIDRLERFFGGIAHLTKRPEALFIVDTHREATAVYEAGKTGAKVIGMVDTNADPTVVDFPIPANDDAVRSIKLVVEKIGQAYMDGKTMRAKDLPPVSAPAVVQKAIVTPTAVKAIATVSKPSMQLAQNAVIGKLKLVEKKVVPQKVKKILKPTDTKKKASSKKKAVPVKRKK